MAFILKNDNVTCVDVDDTLLLMNYPPEYDHLAIDFTNNGRTERVLPHHKHIKCIKQLKLRGHAVVIWSAGGWDWSNAVAIELGLDDDADIIMCKPKWLIDDLPPNEWTTVFYKQLFEAEVKTKKLLAEMVETME